MTDIETRKVDPDIYPEKAYFAVKTKEAGAQTVYKLMLPDGQAEELKAEASRKLVNHSPTGFSWGYHGSGSAQLALAILLDATTDPQKAVRFHQDFKERFVARWEENWVITRSAILEWIGEMEKNSFQSILNHNIN